MSGRVHGYQLRDGAGRVLVAAVYEQRDVPRLRRLVRLRVCCRLQRTILPDERRRLHSNVSHSAYLPVCLLVLFHTNDKNNNTRLTALCPFVSFLLKQETVCGNGISWAICKSASRSRQITTPVPHHSSFLQAGCPSCRPTNSVKALKAFFSHQRQSSLSR